MKQLTHDEIIRNNVETINQFKILKYLKTALSIFEYDIFLYDKDTIKVVDKANGVGYFKYDKVTKEVLFIDNIKKETYEI